MKERPIPYSAPMVLARIEGRKTQTRRAVKMKQSGWCKEIKGDCWHPNEISEWRLQGDRWFGLMGWYTLAFADCPYGQPGDRLWVREAWRTVIEADYLPPRELNGAHRLWYEADAPHQIGFGKYRPPMFMPRFASRGLDEITDIRVERLQDISAEDAIAEGIKGITKDGKLVKYGIPDSDGFPGTDNTGWEWSEWCVSPIDAYRKLWESINGTGSWDANPWVWVVEFKVVQP